MWFVEREEDAPSPFENGSGRFQVEFGAGRVDSVRRMSERESRVEALRDAVFESDGVTDRAARAAAATGVGQLPPELASYLAKVREESYRITDADVDGLRAAGHGEEEIFELTVAAALGAALGRRDAGLRALRGEA